MDKIRSFLLAVCIALSPKGVFNISVKIYKIFPEKKIGTECFYLACRLTKVIKDVMLAEYLFTISKDDTPEEKEASQLCMSFW